METISFAGEGISPELLPLEELADCAATALARDGGRLLSYGSGAGYTPLRELVAEWFGVHPFRVLLTNGWLQGLSLLAAERVAGREVVGEHPGSEQARRLLLAAGARLLRLETGEAELGLDELEDRLGQARRPALALATPSFQNPSGRTLSREERVRLIGLLGWGETVLVEDDSYAGLRFEGEAPPTLFELSGGRTVYSSSFSLTLAPGLRVGVFVLPEELAASLAARASSTYISPVLLAQATVFEFIQRGAFEPELQRRREALRLRRDAMLAALARHLPAARWTRPEGGIFLLIELAPGSELGGRLARAVGVEAATGDSFGGRGHQIRLNFAAASVEEIEVGIERLGWALDPADGGPGRLSSAGGRS